jgi:hypothetical protein
MDLVSNSRRSLQNMQVSQSYLWHGRTPRPWPLPLGSRTGFHQWLLQKYRWPSHRVFGFPALVFPRPFRPAVLREPKNSIFYVMHITLVTPALQSQLVLRDRLRHQTWLSPQRPWRHMQRISMATTPWWPMTAADDFRTRPLAQRESGAWLNAPRPWRLPIPEHALMVRSITYQQTQTAVNTVTHIPHPVGGDPRIFPGAFLARPAIPSSVMLLSHERSCPQRLRPWRVV